ncbi:hypothetical protein B0H10DRAFT_1939884 [Mycena sp. CBHHK59/15]|nr:hypothetical protein B0H10DRAFT_1939884 [Mycena sp. CBHHK59/15]
MNASSWRLKEFFESMFNYCFPLDFRQEQKMKLKCTFQNQKTVDEFIHELKELYILSVMLMSETRWINFEWLTAEHPKGSLAEHTFSNEWRKLEMADEGMVVPLPHRMRPEWRQRKGSGNTNSSGGRTMAVTAVGVANQMGRGLLIKTEVRTLSSQSMRPQEKGSTNCPKAKSDKRKAEL